MLCWKWQEALNDSGWQPFKRVPTGDKMKEVVGEEDAQLKNLREEWGEEVLEAVKIALDELNENNASGRYSVPTQWNFKAKIKSTRKEVIEYMTASDRKFQEETKVLGGLRRHEDHGDEWSWSTMQSCSDIFFSLLIFWGITSCKSCI
ncbi:hypothetical protein Bca4012_064618 [Brassica carinata]